MTRTDEFEARVAAEVARRRALADPHEVELRQHEAFPDLWGVVIGKIRGLEYRSPRLDDAAYRDEVTAILDAHERIAEERLTARWRTREEDAA